MSEPTPIYRTQTRCSDSFEGLIDELRDLQNVGLLMLRLGDDLDMQTAMSIGRMMVDKTDKSETFAKEIFQFNGGAS